ncbi:Ubiquitin carboxyl-terminal hydrolase 48 [Porphyridium purpureum]|uniref:Ubiquitin carboxyl-terminal hydrolase 48 n=1 Tax=Porphyridium purpureum TaxID=35688 RepID=A0A5J4Z2C9_PORPP|nr:Ubiquitin carboxyl-terminal hydrolase 48 [Porphyridium purpureum]|eukprot:POR2741..scf295_1
MAANAAEMRAQLVDVYGFSADIVDLVLRDPGVTSVDTAVDRVLQMQNEHPAQRASASPHMARASPSAPPQSPARSEQSGTSKFDSTNGAPSGTGNNHGTSRGARPVTRSQTPRHVEQQLTGDEALQQALEMSRRDFEAKQQQLGDWTSHPDQGTPAPSGRNPHTRAGPPSQSDAPLLLEYTPQSDEQDVEMNKAIEASIREQQQQQQQLWTSSSSNTFQNQGGGPSLLGWKQPLPELASERARVSWDIPVGIRNVGNTCYLNSVLQVYFFVSDFRRAILGFRPSCNTIGKTRRQDRDNDVEMSILGEENQGELNRQKPQLEEAQQTENTAEAVQVVQELQQLFGRMAMSTCRYVDPSRLVQALDRAMKGSLHFGGQQDATEFNQKFLDIVEAALEHGSIDATEGIPTAQRSADHPDAMNEAASPTLRQQGSGNTNNLVRRLFSSFFEQQLVLDSGASLEPLRGETSALILDASAGNIDRAMMDFTSTRIEYRHENIPSADHRAEMDCTAPAAPASATGLADGDHQHELESDVRDSASLGVLPSRGGAESGPMTKRATPTRTSVTKNVWFTSLASVLTVYIQRVKFNRETAEAEKSLECFDFAAEWRLDRYLFCNKASILRARAAASDVCHRISATAKEIAALEFYEPAAVAHDSRSPRLSNLKDTKDDIDIAGAMDTAADVDPAQPLRQSVEDTASAVMLPRVPMQLAYQAVLARLHQHAYAEAHLDAEPSKATTIVDTADAHEKRQLISCLQEICARDCIELRALRARLGQLVDEESRAYACVPRNVMHERLLFGVLVHDGVPGSGHYFVYILRGPRAKAASNSHPDLVSPPQWVKISDLSVSDVGADEVWRRAGSSFCSCSSANHSSTCQASANTSSALLSSAYGLVYLDTALAGQIVASDGTVLRHEAAALLPVDVVRQIQRENGQLARELAAQREKERRAEAHLDACKVVAECARMLHATLLEQPSGARLTSFFEFAALYLPALELVVSALDAAYSQLRKVPRHSLFAHCARTAHALDFPILIPDVDDADADIVDETELWKDQQQHDHEHILSELFTGILKAPVCSVVDMSVVQGSTFILQRERPHHGHTASTPQMQTHSGLPPLDLKGAQHNLARTMLNVREVLHVAAHHACALRTYGLALRALLHWQAVLEALLYDLPLLALDRLWCFAKKTYLDTWSSAADNDSMAMNLFLSDPQLASLRREEEMLELLPVVLVCGSNDVMRSLEAAILSRDMKAQLQLLGSIERVARIAICMLERGHFAIQQLAKAWTRFYVSWKESQLDGPNTPMDTTTAGPAGMRGPARSQANDVWSEMEALCALFAQHAAPMSLDRDNGMMDAVHHAQAPDTPPDPAVARAQMQLFERQDEVSVCIESGAAARSEASRSGAGSAEGVVAMPHLLPNAAECRRLCEAYESHRNVLESVLPPAPRSANERDLDGAAVRLDEALHGGALDHVLRRYFPAPYETSSAP